MEFSNENITQIILQFHKLAKRECGRDEYSRLNTHTIIHWNNDSYDYINLNTPYFNNLLFSELKMYISDLVVVGSEYNYTIFKYSYFFIAMKHSIDINGIDSHLTLIKLYNQNDRRGFLKK